METPNNFILIYYSLIINKIKLFLLFHILYHINISKITLCTSPIQDNSLTTGTVGKMLCICKIWVTMARMRSRGQYKNALKLVLVLSWLYYLYM